MVEDFFYVFFVRSKFNLFIDYKDYKCICVFIRINCSIFFIVIVGVNYIVYM